MPSAKLKDPEDLLGATSEGDLREGMMKTWRRVKKLAMARMGMGARIETVEAQRSSRPGPELRLPHHLRHCRSISSRQSHYPTTPRESAALDPRYRGIILEKRLKSYSNHRSSIYSQPAGSGPFHNPTGPSPGSQRSGHVQPPDDSQPNYGQSQTPVPFGGGFVLYPTQGPITPDHQLRLPRSRLPGYIYLAPICLHQAENAYARTLCPAACQHRNPYPFSPPSRNPRFKPATSTQPPPSPSPSDTGQVQDAGSMSHFAALYLELVASPPGPEPEDELCWWLCDSCDMRRLGRGDDEICPKCWTYDWHRDPGQR
ncbi:hypothetical protein QBC47DRAFT_406620 [Echria macrotheca]|uniref:Uncharacterized protein n=1 Tax=Echria macrotheca TaxID=438768 RepID=A0AAJ0B3C0_9PEZI|nr:hypothetical protein QBC47DRAFT_406620 [Echria macrotheca]